MIADTSLLNQSESNVAPKATILIVDDVPDNLSILSELLKDTYKIKAVNSGEKAIKAAKAYNKPDLILLDILMPGLSGYDVIKELKADSQTQNIPVIFLTAMAGEEDEKYGLELGAADYIIKPISAPIVLARVKTHLENKAAADFLRDNNAYLEAEIAKRTNELSEIQDITMLALATLTETKYPGTSNRIRHTQHYVKVLAEALKTHPRFKYFLFENTIAQLFRSAPLYDMGKLGIPDSVLMKAGPLTDKEWEVMKTHTTLGLKAIEHAEKGLNIGADFMRVAKELMHYHHEKWDGSGYPTGIAGDAIPICARLMAVADMYNALVNKRVYKDAITHEQAVKVIAAGKGTNFDPDVVDAFVAVHNEFRVIRVRYHNRRFI